MEEKLTRREKVLNELEAYTLTYIQNEDPTIRCGLSAEEVSEKLLLDRANTSRILNDLYNDGLLIKSLGKPTYFLHKKILSQLYPNTFFPNTIPKDQSIIHIINSPASVEETTGTLKHYDNVIKIGIERSLAKQFEIASAAIIYPPHGLHTLVVGHAGSGRVGFVRELHRYAIENKALPEDAPLVFCDCREYRYGEPNLITILFGEGKTDNRRARKGLLEVAGGGILVLQGTQSLDIETLKRISLLLNNQTYSRIGEAGYPRACNCIIICLANKEHISDNYDLETFYASFPVRVDIPNFHERDCIEILDYVLYFFKRETSNMSLSVTVPKEVIYHIMCSSFADNITKLANVIKATCATAYHKSFKEKNNNKKLVITINDLPESICLQKSKNKKYLQSVKEVIDSIEEDEFHFVPKTPLKIK